MYVKSTLRSAGAQALLKRRGYKRGAPLEHFAPVSGTFGQSQFKLNIRRMGSIKEVY